MEVVRAKRAGACYGVQRALDMAEEVIARQECVYTLGPLIHNPHVVADLKAQGAHVVDAVDEIPQAKNGAQECAVVIRSHGVTPEVLDAVSDRGCRVVDATCPHVSRAQKAAADLALDGCYVVVVGEAGHPEVEGLRAWAQAAGGMVEVVANGSELSSSVTDPVGVVVQTTQRPEALESVVSELEARGFSPRVRNTICSATSQRQTAAADIAREVDAMIVIGGRNSSNTTRLAEICADCCPRTFHVESADELSPEQLAGCEVVGVTAGASTPENQIAAVEERLRSF